MICVMVIRTMRISEGGQGRESYRVEIAVDILERGARKDLLKEHLSGDLDEVRVNRVNTWEQNMIVRVQYASDWI